MFVTGYLTQRGRAEGDRYDLAIPNREIRKIYTGQIMTLFKKDVEHDGEALQSFCEALEKGDAEGVERQFCAYLEKTVSIRDTFVRKLAGTAGNRPEVIPISEKNTYLKKEDKGGN